MLYKRLYIKDLIINKDSDDGGTYCNDFIYIYDFDSIIINNIELYNLEFTSSSAILFDIDNV